MKLIPILLEESVDLSDLEQIDDILAQEIEKAEKEQTNEIIGTITLGLAIPGLLNGLIKIAKGLIKKSGIDLSKKDDNTFTKIERFIEYVANKIDQYVDYPIDSVLKRTVTDPVKRKKIKGAIKVGFIVTMAIVGAIDISNSSELVGKVREFSAEIAGDVIRSASQRDAAKVATTIKNYISALG